MSKSRILLKWAKRRGLKVVNLPLKKPEDLLVFTYHQFAVVHPARWPERRKGK